MAQESKVEAQTQTMEDILSSIRKIINEEVEDKSNSIVEEDDDEPILELNQVVNEDGSVSILEPISTTSVHEIQPTDDKAMPVLDEVSKIQSAQSDDLDVIETLLPEDFLEESPIPEVLNTIFQEDESTALSNKEFTQQEEQLNMTQETPVQELDDILINPKGSKNQKLSESEGSDLDDLEEAVLSRTVADASVATLAALSRRVNRRKGEPVGDQTVDQLMRSVLKPLIREWLDDHLPQVVERIVAREVARLVQRSEFEV